MIEKIQGQSGLTILLTTHYMDEADKLCQRIAIVDHGKLVALDTPTRLKDSVPADEVVEAEFSGAPANWREALAALPQVISVTEQDGVTHITSKNGPETLAAIMDLARQQDVDSAPRHRAQHNPGRRFFALYGTAASRRTRHQTARYQPSLQVTPSLVEEGVRGVCTTPRSRNEVLPDICPD